jgi:SAM-dependent methyltransferase
MVQGFIGGRLAAFLLRDRRMPVETLGTDENSKFRRFFGSEILQELAGKTVLDFGCGTGNEVIEVAQLMGPSTTVIGLDSRDSVLNAGRKQAIALGLENCCRFMKSVDEPVDVIFSIDAFEHFPDPEGVIQGMYRLLKPGGKVLISFGPPWYHPLGSHFPGVWWNLIYTEKALMSWRSQFKTDGAQRFCEVEGGLNQMTIGKFERLLSKSKFKVERFALIPIRATRRLHCRLTREFTTAVVQAVLVRG